MQLQVLATNVVKKHKVEAIHLGYGFLSENVAFVRRYREEEIGYPVKKPMSEEED